MLEGRLTSLNTALSIAFACSVARIRPRAVRGVQVVLVTTSAGDRDGYEPPATNPAKCAMSTINRAIYDAAKGGEINNSEAIKREQAGELRAP
jgi:hypothetical protein